MSSNDRSDITNFVKEAGGWCFDTFGELVFRSPVERAARLLEEAVEVAQALNVPEAMAARIMVGVYRKPKGELRQELGGVIVIWSVLCAAIGLDANSIMRDAISDCWKRQGEIRTKLKTKIEAGMSNEIYGTAPPSRGES